jgi:hypothetical protein
LNAELYFGNGYKSIEALSLSMQICSQVRLSSCFCRFILFLLNFFLWRLVGGDGGLELSFGSLSTLAMEKKQESHKVQRLFLSGPSSYKFSG